MGILGKQPLKVLESLGRVEAHTTPGNHEAGEASLKKTTTVLEGVSDFQTLRNILIAFKKEVD